MLSLAINKILSYIIVLDYTRDGPKLLKVTRGPIFRTLKFSGPKSIESTKKRSIKFKIILFLITENVENS